MIMALSLGVEKSGVEISFTQKFVVEKSGVEMFIVEKSGIKRSGVESWGWKVQGWDVLQPWQMPPMPSQFLRPCYDAAFRAEMYLGCKSVQSQFAQYFFSRARNFLQLYCNLCAKSADENCLITTTLNYLVLAGGNWGFKILGIWLWFIFIIY